MPVGALHGDGLQHAAVLALLPPHDPHHPARHLEEAGGSRRRGGGGGVSHHLLLLGLHGLAEESVGGLQGVPGIEALVLEHHLEEVEEEQGEGKEKEEG